jgi:outer membrane protein assembly factor BamB
MATNHGLHAHDARTGERLWSARVPGAAGTPLVLDELCVVAGRGGLHARALDKKGRKAWTFAVKDRVTTAPARAEGLAFFYADAQLLAIDLATLKLAWSAPARQPQRATPVISGDLVLYLGTAGLTAADRRTGKRVWVCRDDEAQVGGRPWACTFDALVLRDDEGFIRAYELGTGKPTWRSRAGRDEPYGIGSAGPIVVGQTVIAVTVENAATPTTFLSGLDLATGRLLWDIDRAGPRRAIAQEQSKTGSTYEGSWSWHCTPFVAGGLLYAQIDAGVVALQ